MNEETHGVLNKQSLRFYKAEMKCEQSYHSRTLTKTALTPRFQSVMAEKAKLERGVGFG